MKRCFLLSCISVAIASCANNVRSSKFKSCDERTEVLSSIFSNTSVHVVDGARSGNVTIQIAEADQARINEFLESLSGLAFPEGAVQAIRDYSTFCTERKFQRGQVRTVDQLSMRDVLTRVAGGYTKYLNVENSVLCPEGRNVYARLLMLTLGSILTFQDSDSKRSLFDGLNNYVAPFLNRTENLTDEEFFYFPKDLFDHLNNIVPGARESLVSTISWPTVRGIINVGPVALENISLIIDEGAILLHRGEDLVIIPANAIPRGLITEETIVRHASSDSRAM